LRGLGNPIGRRQGRVAAQHQAQTVVGAIASLAGADAGLAGQFRPPARPPTEADAAACAAEPQFLIVSGLPDQPPRQEAAPARCGQQAAAQGELPALGPSSPLGLRDDSDELPAVAESGRELEAIAALDDEPQAPEGAALRQGRQLASGEGQPEVAGRAQPGRATARKAQAAADEEVVAPRAAAVAQR